MTVKEAITEEEIHEIWGEGESNPSYEHRVTKYLSGDTDFKLRSHHGTHIDAPAHKIPNGKTINQYSLEKFINDATLIDLRRTGILARERRAITVEDLKQFDLEHYARIVKAVIFYTGFCDEMQEKEGKLTGQQKLDFEKTFPYFTQQAAEYVSNLSNLNIVGIDSFAFDPSGSNSEAHRTFFSKDTLLLETLVNLRQLEEHAERGIFTLHCAPLNYEKADAAQTRAYAVLH
jgi:kynurenine formamidase